MKLESLLTVQCSRLKKALDLFNYSYQKVKDLTTDAAHMDNDVLEIWESFSARFSRVVEIFLMRYLKTRILIEDPGFRGTLRDFLNQAEKMNLIAHAEAWLEIRELRNMTAHDYNDSDLEFYFKRLLAETPKLLAIRNNLTQ